MNREVVKRLWLPFLVFIVFAGSALMYRDLLFGLGREAGEASQRVLLYIVRVGIWMSAAHFLNRIIVLFVWDGLVKRTLGTPVPRLLKDVATIIIYSIAITGIMRTVFNQDITGILATSGLIGLVLGFALRNIILDVFTGIAINIDRPFKLGDWIMVHGASPEQNIVGQVIEINWRTTRMYTDDDSIIMLPNSLLSTMVVTNFWGAGPESRFDATIYLDFSVPTERARRILLAGAKAVVEQMGILAEPEPQVIISGTNSFGIEYKVRYWMSHWSKGMTLTAARSHVMTSVLAHLKQAGITPAYPKQDLFYAEMPTRQFDSQALEDRTELLRRTELFRHLDIKELSKLATNMRRRPYKKGESVIKQGDAGDSMFILSEGLLHVFLSTNEKPETKIGQIEPGEFFGEMSLLTGDPRSATVLAVTDVIAHEITKDNMRSLLHRRPEIAETISSVVAERRVRNLKTMAVATPEERIKETQSLAGQILNKMKAFFKGVFEKKEV
jgi:small-conductance mechanosensitive channel/CRP-like cAMP-binding protein